MHECWSLVNAGLSGADHDAVPIYADNRDAVLITHGLNSARQRHRFTLKQHVFLRCHQVEMMDLLGIHIHSLSRSWSDITLVSPRSGEGQSRPTTSLRV
jgi:hypothetical protein